ncbi:hypothetical protein TNIN_136841 [Trichonephila inaurata madagascariensis]|uniref:Uncharacterized protein n=1 Tax=Trichonephila inaurata madagascariensis TaxID=2747483 RepID=A0A8X6XTG3_9ARAC|nr:hypothetical protein TNIN_136841 [Trichonephila inaurata madagascariensis]
MKLFAFTLNFFFQHTNDLNSKKNSLRVLRRRDIGNGKNQWNKRKWLRKCPTYGKELNKWASTKPSPKHIMKDEEKFGDRESVYNPRRKKGRAGGENEDAGKCLVLLR